MKSFIFEFIDLKRISNIEEDVINALSLCFTCGKVPLPSYRSYKIPTNLYCKTCYSLLNAKEKHLIEPTRLEYQLLEKLKIKCENFEKGCQEIFSILSPELILEHQENCLKPPKTFLSLKPSDCLRCKIVTNKTKTHDCLTCVMKSFESSHKKEDNDIKALKESLREEFQKEISCLKLEIHKENTVLKETIEDLKKQIYELKLETLEKDEMMKAISTDQQEQINTIENKIKSVNPIKDQRSSFISNQDNMITLNPKINTNNEQISSNVSNQNMIITPNPSLSGNEFNSKMIAESRNIIRTELKKEKALQYYIMINDEVNRTILQTDPNIVNKRLRLFSNNTYEYEITCLEILNMRNQITPSVTRDLLKDFKVSQEDYEIAINSCSIYELSAKVMISEKPLFLGGSLPNKDIVRKAFQNYIQMYDDKMKEFKLIKEIYENSNNNKVILEKYGVIELMIDDYLLITFNLSYKKLVYLIREFSLTDLDFKNFIKSNQKNDEFWNICFSID